LINVPKEGQSGLLHDVDGGTLFLDEIHRLPQEAQAMLLLPIEGRAFHPAIGKGEPTEVDVKFIFATNIDLETEAREGRFPFDLLQRLAQSQIRVPPLSERKDDIPALAEHFLEECSNEFQIDDPSFSPSLLQHLRDRNWDGNVRELRAFIRELVRRAAFELDTVLTNEHIPISSVETQRNRESNPPVATSDSGDSPDRESQPPASLTHGTDGFWNEVELRELNALRRHRFRLAAAEQELGLSSKSRTLTNHLRGMCFKALAHSEFQVTEAARLVVGREDEALLDRCTDRIESYLYMVEKHVAAHTTKTLFNNLPRDYRKFVELSIQKARS
jgi:DNA-binding NtrC family response regulator